MEYLTYSLDYPNRKRLGISLSLSDHSERFIAFVIAVIETETRETRSFSKSIIDEEYRAVVRFWDDKLSAIQVDTPDPI